MWDSYDSWTKRLLLISSVLTFMILAFAAYDELFRADWYVYQSRYKERLLESSGTEAERTAADRFAVRPRQLFLPELRRVDRCVTCHAAIDNPAMAGAAQPLTAHSGTVLLNHPKETFGCVICHAGQGRATSADDAHGHVAHWLEPMLPADEVESACARCHMERSLEDAPRYSRAMDLFYEKGCLFCHKLRGQGGDKGPDITHAGETNDTEWHFRHFKDPKSVVATSEMPNMNLTDDEASALTFLMMSFGGDPVPTELISNPKPDGGDSEITAEAANPLAAKGYVGSRICLGCHENLTPGPVDGWRKSKMTSTFERIRDEPARESCLPCHATGFNPVTGHFSEEGVGCEGCHGPGQEPVRLVLEGRVDKHKELNHIDANSKLVCANCHDPHVPVGTHADHYRGVR